VPAGTALDQIAATPAGAAKRGTMLLVEASGCPLAKSARLIAHRSPWFENEQETLPALRWSNREIKEAARQK